MSRVRSLVRWVGMERVLVPFEPSPQVLEENKARRKERDRLFLDHGIDRGAMTGFVLDKAGGIESPVLDIGTGRGLTAFELARRGARVITVDISEEELKGALTGAVAEKVDSAIEFHVADANVLPFADGSFRLVTMVNVLHHMEGGKTFLPEVSRVLAHGGKFVVADFDEEGFRILDGLYAGRGEEHTRHRNETIESVGEKLYKYGLKCTGRHAGFYQDVLVAGKSA